MIAFPRIGHAGQAGRADARGVATLAIAGRASAGGCSGDAALYRGETAGGLTQLGDAVRWGAAYSGTLRIAAEAKRQIVFLKARAVVAAGTRTCTATFGVTCLSATRAAVNVSSGTVRVVIPGASASHLLDEPGASAPGSVGSRG